MLIPKFVSEQKAKRFSDPNLLGLVHQKLKFEKKRVVEKITLDTYGRK